jgi:hypothetical protein
VTGTSGIANPGIVAVQAFKSSLPYTIRIFNMLGKNILTTQSDKEDLQATVLLQHCAKGVYVANVYRNGLLTKNKVLLK